MVGSGFLDVRECFTRETSGILGIEHMFNNISSFHQVILFRTSQTGLLYFLFFFLVHVSEILSLTLQRVGITYFTYM